MKNLLLSIVWLSTTHISMCQVQGKVLTGTGQPVVQASVRLLHASDSSIIKSGLSNSEGIFKLTHSERGKYILQISSVGFITWDLMIEMPMAGDIGTVVLREDLQQLAAVTVKGTKPLFQQSAYGMTINVERDMLSKGSSVLQVLERSPGVVIDHRNNSIALNGKSGVMIMLNGKLMRLPMDQVTRLLNGMSADEVVSIELLTTPPAGYDAEGSAGLINIITRKSKKQGLTGSVSISAGYGKKEKTTTGFSLTHNAKRNDWHGSYSWSRKFDYGDLFIISAQNMPVLGGQMEVIASSTTNILRKTHDVSAGIDSRPDSTIKLGASIIFNNSVADSKVHTQAVYAVVPDSLLLFNGTMKGENRWRNIIASAYVSKQLRNSGALRLDLDYLQFTNHNPTQVYNSFLKKDGSIAGSNNDTLFSPLQQGFANTTIRAGVAQLAYSRQLNPKTKIESGIKWNTTQVSSESGIASLVNGSWAGRNETTNALAMNESIGAAFVSVSTSIDSSTRLTAGARYEYADTRMINTQTHEPTVTRSRGIFFPGIFLSRKLPGDQNLQLSFSKRVSRPSYNDLASYVSYSDPSAVYTGNPLLKATISETLQFGYTYRDLAFSLQYSHESNPIARYQITESPLRNLLYVSPQNLAWQNTFNFQATLPWKVNEWWNITAGWVGGPRKMKIIHTIRPAVKTYFSFSANLSQAFQLPHRFSLEVSGWYNSTSYNGSVKVSGFGALNAGIKKDFQNAGSLQLTVTDMLRTMSIESRYGTLTTEAFQIKNMVRYSAESARSTVFQLTYSKSFGGGSKTSAPSRAGEERIRISNL